MYTYGYLFYLPLTIIFSLLFIINGVIRKRPLGYYVMALLAVIYINKAIELAFFPFLIADIPEFTIIIAIVFMFFAYRIWLKGMSIYESAGN